MDLNIKPARLKVPDRLGERVGSFFAPLHPEERVADVLGVGGAAESHESAFDPAVARKALGGDAAVFGGMEDPTVRAVLKVGVLDVPQE